MRLNVRRVVNGVRNIKYGISAIIGPRSEPTKAAKPKADKSLKAKPKTVVSPKPTTNPQPTNKPAAKKRWR